MHKRMTGLLVVLAMAAIASPAIAATGVLDNHAIVEMVQLGLGQQVIEAKIHASTTNFDTSPQALAELKRKHVPSAIIADMIGAGSTTVVTTPGNGRGGPQQVQINQARSLFEYTTANGQLQVMTPVRVTSQMSDRKAWIPFYTGGPETFLFIDGRHASLKTSATPAFVTNLNPISVRLVHLGEKRGRDARFVVFQGSTTDREVQVTTTALGNGDVKITPAQPLKSGEEYAFLVSPQLPQGVGFWAYFMQNAAAGSAYDFGVQ
ncbi:MAG TPA: hypothetical protein VF264_00440 [Rhodanobacteraceae bacterium]